MTGFLLIPFDTLPFHVYLSNIVRNIIMNIYSQCSKKNNLGVHKKGWNSMCSLSCSPKTA